MANRKISNKALIACLESNIKELKEYIKIREWMLTKLNIQENDKIDKLRTDLLKLTKTYLPDIPGLEVRVKVSLDDEDEGFLVLPKSEFSKE